MAENGILDYQGMNQAIYRGATSNIVVDTQSMSIEIGAGNTSHTSNLHFECNHDANVASIKLNSNVTTEFSRSKKLIKYPRVALTQNDESGTSGYVASANSEYHNEYAAFRAFNNKGPGYDYGATIGWEPANIATFGNDGIWGGTNASGASTSSSANTTMTLEEGNTIYGEWLQIQLPTKIRLEYVNFLIPSGSGHAMAHRGPRAGYILGSNNGTNWTTLKNWSGIVYDTWTAYYDKFYKFDIDKEVDNYQYFRFVWTETAGTSSLSRYASCQELEFWGVPEYDPEAHGTDVTIKSKANVPNTDWLEVYYDAKDLTSISGTIADLSGKSVTGSLNGNVSIDTLNNVKSFSFDGSGDYISGTLTNTGDFDFTVSTWVFETNGTTNNTIWMIGSGSSSNNPNPSVALGIDSAGSLDFFVFSGIEIRMTNFRDTFGINKWHHIVCTRTGTTLKYFINGVDQGRPIDNSHTLSIAANSIFNIGARTGNQLGNNPMHGKIANFRIFNRVLSTDEIYQLYAYQKEYFGHSTNNLTLKTGRLGIGTSEPRAALDVRGDMYGGCPVFWFASSSSTSGFLNYNQIHVNKGGGIQGDKFIAPISGYYHMTLHHLGNTGTGRTHRLEWFLNGEELGYDGLFGLYATTGTNAHYQNIAGSLIWYMNVGDYMQVNVKDHSMNGNLNGWSGFFLST